MVNSTRPTALIRCYKQRGKWTDPHCAVASAEHNHAHLISHLGGNEEAGELDRAQGCQSGQRLITSQLAGQLSRLQAANKIKTSTVR